MALQIVCTKTLKDLKVVKTGLFALGDEIVAGDKYASEDGNCEVIVVSKKIEVEVLIPSIPTPLPSTHPVVRSSEV